MEGRKQHHGEILTVTVSYIDWRSVMKFVRVNEARREALDNLFNMYVHELSQYNSWLAEQLDHQGVFLRGVVDDYMANEDVICYLITDQGELAGFLILLKNPAIKKSLDYSIEEFFVIHRYRKTGLARKAWKALFRKYPGRYCVQVLKKNLHAHRFIRNYVAGQGVHFSFTRCDDFVDNYIFEMTGHALL